MGAKLGDGMLKCKLAGVLLLALTTAPAAFAQGVPVPLPYTQSKTAVPATTPQLLEIMREHADYLVEPNGSYTVKQDVIVRILSPQGLQIMKQAAVSYMEGYQDADILQAYTLKPDGKRIDVTSGKYVMSMGATAAPTFQSMKLKVAVFQNVEVGDEVGWTTTVTQHIPWFANSFSLMRSFSNAIRQHDMQITLTVPRSLDMHVDAAGLQGGETPSNGSARVWVWTRNVDTPARVEAGQVSDIDTGNHLIVSSMPDFASVAKAYQAGAADKIAVAPDIQTLADQLTSGVADRREQARRLYNWVSGNIKYLNMPLGNGGIVPHPAVDVLHSRYGDCKDHAVLLQSLLLAKGINSSSVLINALNSYKLGTVAAPELFNHVITYIPEFNLFLDSTARFAPFGILPFEDSDKDVLITTTGAIAHTPVMAASASQVHSHSHVHLNADGTGSGDTQFSASGQMAIGMRAAMSTLAPGSEADFIRNSVEQGAIDGTLTKDDPSMLIDPYQAQLHYTLANVGTFPGPAAISLWLGYHPFPLTLALNNAEATRLNTYQCGSYIIENETVIDLPAGTKIISLPKNDMVAVDGYTLSADYSRPGPATVRQDVTLRAEHPHATCTPSYYDSVHTKLMKALSLLNGQVLYR
jgi:hypothetical protein